MSRAGLLIVFSAGLVGTGLVSAVPTARAQPRLTWPTDWARVHPASYIVSSVSVGSALVFDQAYRSNSEAHTRGPWLLDEGARGALRAGTNADRERAATLSDILLAGMLAWPVLDGLAVAGLGYQSPDVAWQLTMITLEALAADLVLGTLIKLIVHRERPHGALCSRADRRLNPDRCDVRGRTRSFYSGHASAAFTAAGATCMSHAHLPLYGDLAADTLACGGAMLTATIVGVLRLLADRHWSTDVLTGALMGLATGLLLPYALHYGLDPRDTRPAPSASAPLTATPALLSFGGTF